MKLLSHFISGTKLTALTISCLFAGVACKEARVFSPGEEATLKSMKSLVGKTQLEELQASLKGIETAGDFVLVIDSCASCEVSAGLTATPNDTQTPMVMATELSARFESPGRNVQVVPQKQLRGIPPEAFLLAPMAFHISFQTKRIIASKGPFATWSDCLASLEKNRPEFDGS